MSAYSIGVSAMSANQRALDLVGQNVANAGTPGYHRQVANLVMRVSGFTGNGVEVANVTRMRSGLLEEAVLRNTVEAKAVSAQLEPLRQLESYLSPGDGSIDDLLNKMFDAFQHLSAQPENQAERRVVLANVSSLTQKLNTLTSDFDHMRLGLDDQARQMITDINSMAPQIAQLNQTIQSGTIQGIDTSDLRDQRDQLISKLSELTDVRTIDMTYGQVNVLAGGAPLVMGSQYSQFQYTVDTSDQGIVTMAGSTSPLAFSGGRLGGLLQVRNQTLPDFRGRLDALADQLVRGLDGIQATGLGTQPLTALAGQRGVSDPTVTLATANLGFPPTAGTLTISVTAPNGDRKLTQLNIDPATQSLNDVRDAINANVANLTASVNPLTQTLDLVADPTYSFDFAGRLAIPPDVLALTGTATPQVSGLYSGTTNDVYTFTVVDGGIPGSATPPYVVGVTPNLSLQATNAASQVLASWNIGQGYEPGTPLAPVNGVRVKLSAGTVNLNDAFQSVVTAQADSGGILTALGLNSLFQGNDASSLSVRPDLLTNPDRLAVSRSGQVGDGANVQRLASLRDAAVLGSGTQTLAEFNAAMVGDVGSQVQDLGQRQDAKDFLGQRLEAERQSVSGVDPNEELVRMLQYQRAFQMSARYLSVVNDSLNEVFRIVG